MERESPTGRRRGGSVRVILLPVIALASVICTSTLSACLKVTSRFTKAEYLSQAEILSMQQHDESVVLPAGFDVLDIGTSKGNGSSIFLATALQKHFGSNNVITEKTLGIDIDPAKVEECNKNGRTCIRGNVLKLQANDTTTSSLASGTTHGMCWNTCRLATAKTMWHKASSLVSGFSLFHGPVFDDANVLQKAGFHRFYEDWSGHSCHFDSTMMVDAIESSPIEPFAYIVVLLKPFNSSDSDIVLPNGSLRNSHHFDSLIHPQKSIVKFEKNLYEEMRACAISSPLNKLDLYSALALDDVLSAVPNWRGKVVECRLDSDAPDESYNDQDCLHRLETIASATIVKNTRSRRKHLL